ncbi:group II intron maturase-specific domain-containing protein [Streptomyces sp. NPDC048483]|uniref:group II intron maturase-specific domain-containing protein n=1 Tax=Streptomyces sp. NPDC048483 TaxID=3154927 RepID=UPI00342B8187
MAEVLSPMGLRLSEEKTGVVHLDEGFTFLGFRIQRQRQQGRGKRYVYTWPSDKALTSVKHKVKAIAQQTTNVSLGTLLRRINLVLRGWTAYFQHGVSSHTFHDLSHYVWWLIGRWLRKKHRHASRGSTYGVGIKSTDGCGQTHGERAALPGRIQGSHSLPVPRRENPHPVGRVRGAPTRLTPRSSGEPDAR